MPASSDPASIYRRMLEEVRKGRIDRHSNEVKRQKKGIKAVALLQKANGTITAEQAAEISTIVNNAQVADWTPLLYVIPYSAVAGRVTQVPVGKWAGLEPEYVVEDLVEGEFHVIEP